MNAARGHPDDARGHDVATPPSSRAAWERRASSARARSPSTTQAGQVRGEEASAEEGDWISIDGTTGEVILGQARRRGLRRCLQVALEKSAARRRSRRVYRARSTRILAWAGRARGASACAPTPTRRHDARVARRLRRAGHRALPHRAHVLRGASGSCAVREMILAETAEARRAALAKILPMQREDFVGHLPRDGRAAGHDPPARSAAPRVPAARATARRADRARS